MWISKVLLVVCAAALCVAPLTSRAAENEAPAQPPGMGTETQPGSTPALPQTAGNTYLKVMTGFALLGGGLAALFASRRKSIA